MQNNVEKDVYVNGTNDSVSVANGFADVFRSVYRNSNDDNVGKN